MEIKIKGSEKGIKKLIKVNSLFMKRNKLEIVSEESKEEPKLKATEVAELIAKCENLEDLKQYSTDERQVVKSAYNKKIKELE